MDRVALALLFLEVQIMRIEKIKWDGGQGLEEFIVWGIKPIKALTHYLQDEGDIPQAAYSEERVIATSYLLGDLVEKAEECIKRFLEELNELDKEGAP
jgi:hypothetical protein